LFRDKAGDGAGEDAIAEDVGRRAVEPQGDAPVKAVGDTVQ
jgi:hypothetical protein